SAGSDGGAAALRLRYAALAQQRQRHPFQRALQIESSDGQDGLTGEVVALVDSPFAIAAVALDAPSQWCDILILHLNTKYCRAETNARGTVLHVVIGKKYDQPIDQAYRVDFVYRVAARNADYLQVK